MKKLFLGLAVLSTCAIVSSVGLAAQPGVAMGAAIDTTTPEQPTLARGDPRPQFARKNLLYVAFTLDLADWPKHTTVAVSRMGYVLVAEGVATNRYHFASYSLQSAQLAAFMALLYDEMPLFDIRSQARPRNLSPEVDWGKEKWGEPESLRFEAAFATPALMYLGDSVYSDVSSKVAPLINWLRQWQTLTRQQWAKQQQPDSEDLSMVSVLETEDVQFIEHLMLRMHSGLH